VVRVRDDDGVRVNGRRGLWWLSGFALVVGLLAGGAVLMLGSADLLDRGDKLGSVVGAVVAVASLLVSLVSLRVAIRSQPLSSRDPVMMLDDAAADLAGWVARQWEREASARWLDRAQPLRVRWSSTSRAVAPPAAAVVGSDVAGRVLRVRLAGSVSDVVEGFGRLAAAQLVVLGEPGAGKSVMALLLTLGLSQRWRPGEPVPVLMPVGDWDPRQHLDTWLARRLVRDYPALGDMARYGPDAAVALVASRRVMPVLDGLDELPQAVRADAVRRLNEALGAGRALVVTCRSSEYEATVSEVGAPVGRAAVVELEPVTVADAVEYLPAGQINGEQRWAPVLAHLRGQPGGPLAKALRTPLMVYLARTAYAAPGKDPAQLCQPQFSSAARIEDHLLEAYLPAVYAAHPAPPAVNGSSPPLPHRYSVAQAHRFLAALAGSLNRWDGRDIAWWHLPDMISFFRLWVGLAAGLVVGLAVGLVGRPLLGLVFGVCVGLTIGLRGTAAEPSRIDLDMPRLIKSILAELPLGLVVAVPVGVLVVGSRLGLPRGLAFGVVVGLALVFALVLAFGLAGGIAAPTREIDLVNPRSVLRADRTLTTATMLAFGCVGGLACGLAGGPAGALAFGLTFGLVGGLAKSAAGAYLLASCWLAASGRLPWSPMRFLDDAYDRGVLRQVGAVYQFRHTHLQDHLAGRTLSRRRPPPSARSALSEQRANRLK
jgi:hypothetical protein